MVRNSLHGEDPNLGQIVQVRFVAPDAWLVYFSRTDVICKSEAASRQ